MDLRHLRYASVVAKERNFTRAAQRLDVAQSAVSDQIAKLEGELGFALFVRAGRGIEVTDLGRTFIADAERILADPRLDGVVVPIGSGVLLARRRA